MDGKVLEMESDEMCMTLIHDRRNEEKVNSYFFNNTFLLIITSNILLSQNNVINRECVMEIKKR